MSKSFFIFRHIFWGAAAIAAFSAVTMLLWNWLMPAIFGLTAICFWQALGLLALCRILFGGIGWKLRFAGMHHHHRNPIREKWLKMTPEEQTEFLKKRRFGHGFRGGFGHDFFQHDEPGKQA